MPRLDVNELRKSLGILPHKHQMVFAASCCERLFPNYRAFTLLEHWGRPQLLRTTLDEIWKSVEEEALSRERVLTLIQAMNTITPHTEDFTSIFVSLAEDAVAAVIYTLEHHLDGDVERVVLVARKVVESVESYLEAVNGVSLLQRKKRHPELTHEEWMREMNRFDQWIDQDAPLMIAEIEQQAWDLQKLHSHPKLTKDMLHEMVSLSRIVGVQPFARGLVTDLSQ